MYTTGGDQKWCFKDFLSCQKITLSNFKKDNEAERDGYSLVFNIYGVGNKHGGREDDALVEVVAYNHSWSSKFESERALLEDILGPWLAGRIQHIGSTAVPLLPAKPVIDIMAPVHTLELSRPAIESATNAGYVYYPYKSDVMHWFCKPSPSFRTHHLHLVPLGSRLWFERLAFRNALRTSPALAAEYAELKLRLAVEFRRDREVYTDAKEPFVRRVLSELTTRDQDAT